MGVAWAPVLGWPCQHAQCMGVAWAPVLGWPCQHAQQMGVVRCVWVTSLARRWPCQHPSMQRAMHADPQHSSGNMRCLPCCLIHEQGRTAGGRMAGKQHAGMQACRHAGMQACTQASMPMVPNLTKAGCHSTAPARSGTHATVNQHCCAAPHASASLTSSLHHQAPQCCPHQDMAPARSGAHCAAATAPHALATWTSSPH
eukprot:363789-Chlamydomonas_euryale.AAC.6